MELSGIRQALGDETQPLHKFRWKPECLVEHFHSFHGEQSNHLFLLYFRVVFSVLYTLCILLIDIGVYCTLFMSVNVIFCIVTAGGHRLMKFFSSVSCGDTNFRKFCGIMTGGLLFRIIIRKTKGGYQNGTCGHQTSSHHKMRLLSALVRSDQFSAHSQESRSGVLGV